MTPGAPAQIAGLVLFVLLVAAAAVVGRWLYLRWLTRRVRAAAERPLPGRTRNQAPVASGWDAS